MSIKTKNTREEIDFTNFFYEVISGNDEHGQMTFDALQDWESYERGKQELYNRAVSQEEYEAGMREIIRRNRV